MAHSMLESALESAAKASLDANSPMVFLNGLESIHANWHRRRFATRGLGFLIFHWEVLEAFRRCLGPSIWSRGVKSFRPSDFTKFGWSYNVTSRASKDNLQSLANFSLAIETWHNEAHMAIGMAFDIEDEMMDPTVNIYYREFWRLHYFINDRFLREIRRYDSVGSVAAKIERIERDHHDSVHEI